MMGLESYENDREALTLLNILMLSEQRAESAGYFSPDQVDAEIEAELERIEHESLQS